MYFNHSIHVKQGVGCATCHGQVDKMPLMYQKPNLMMSWCLDCHRNPAKYVRPRDQVFNMAWEPPADDPGLGARLVKEYKIGQVQQLTSCSTLPQVELRAENTWTSLQSDPVSRAPTAGCTGAAWASWPTRRSSASTCTASFPSRRQSGTTRRAAATFLKLMSASLALAGVGACTQQPPEAIVPYVRQPEDIVPGRPLFFASAIPLGGVRPSGAGRKPHGAADQNRG